MPNKLNIIFAGTPEFSAEILKSLYKNKKINITAVYTQPDRPSGRGKKITGTAVKQLVLENNNILNINIPVEQPDNFKKSNPNRENYISKLNDYKPDLIIVAAYGLILPKAILDIPKYGCINIHTSLLPRWRGAAPIQRSILAGDTETGVSIQQMDIGLDTGDVIDFATCEITDQDTTISLTKKLLELSINLLQTVINNIISNEINYTKQNNSLVTYAEKLNKAEAIIDFNSNAEFIHRQIRAFNPWPGAKIKLDNNDFIKLYTSEVVLDDNNNQSQTKPNIGTITESNRNGISIQCANNKIKLLQLQFSGGKIISAQDALNGKFKELLLEGNCL